MIQIEVESLPQMSEMLFPSNPEVKISFPNGVKSKMVLWKHFSSKNQKESDGCNYLGYLESDPKSCLAMTGCPGRDQLEFTINSKSLNGSNKFILHQNGSLETPENPFKVLFQMFLNNYFL